MQRSDTVPKLPHLLDGRQVHEKYQYVHLLCIPIHVCRCSQLQVLQCMFLYFFKIDNILLEYNFFMMLQAYHLILFITM